MKSFEVHFHAEDQFSGMTVQKLSEEDFDKVVAGGARQLFELDTNFGFFLFADAEDSEGNQSYLALKYEDSEGEKSPSEIYSFELEDFYELLALFMSQVYFDDDPDNDGDEEEHYGPIHHLAHLLMHISESGSEVTP
jgi:hypothetical protein